MKKCYMQYARMAEELRNLRHQHELTRDQLAVLVGCKPWAIRATEECLCLPKYDLLKKLATALGRSEDHLINLLGDDQPEPKTEPKTVYPETEERIYTSEPIYVGVVNSPSYSAYRVWAFISDMARLKEEAAMRIFSHVEDVLANPENLKVDQR